MTLLTICITAFRCDQPCSRSVTIISPVNVNKWPRALLQVHRSVLTRDGSTFQDMFSLDDGGREFKGSGEEKVPVDGSCNQHPIHLHICSITLRMGLGYRKAWLSTILSGLPATFPLIARLRVEYTVNGIKLRNWTQAFLRQKPCK